MKSGRGVDGALQSKRANASPAALLAFVEAIGRTDRDLQPGQSSSSLCVVTEGE